MSEPNRVYYPATIMARAWVLARAGAHRFGGSARLYLASALRQSWEVARATAARILEQRARVLASIDSLAADIAASEAYMARWYAEQAAAKVVPFPVRHPAPVPAFRRAA